MEITFPIGVNVKVNLDPEYNRALFKEDNLNTKDIYSKIETLENCRNFTIKLERLFFEIYKPIKLQMIYELENKIGSSTEFCEQCVMVDPKVSNIIESEIPIATGCVKEICVADLSVSGFIENNS